MHGINQCSFGSLKIFYRFVLIFELFVSPLWNEITRCLFSIHQNKDLLQTWYVRLASRINRYKHFTFV
jgi:hypothetical protein